MITHHIPDTLTPRNEPGPASVAGKQAAPSSDGRFGPPAVSPRRWTRRGLSLLGIALPMVAGALVNYPWDGGELFEAAWIFGAVVLGMILSVVSGACLLRSTWAFVLMPLAWVGGELLGAVLIPILQGGWPALQAEQQFWEAQGMILALAFSPLVLCAALGAGGWTRERLQRLSTVHAHYPGDRIADSL